MPSPTHPSSEPRALGHFGASNKFSKCGFVIGVGSALFIFGLWIQWKIVAERIADGQQARVFNLELMPGIFLALGIAIFFAAKWTSSRPQQAAVEGTSTSRSQRAAVGGWLLGLLLTALIVAGVTLGLYLFMALGFGGYNTVLAIIFYLTVFIVIGLFGLLFVILIRK